jgi:preprotein translocase subunit SecF
MNYAGYEAVVQDAIRATEVATPAINHHRTRKIWTTVVCMFLVISVLAVVITGELRSIFVVGVVSIALGLLGSLMAALTPEKSASA